MSEFLLCGICRREPEVRPLRRLADPDLPSSLAGRGVGYSEDQGAVSWCDLHGFGFPVLRLVGARPLPVVLP